MLTQNRYLQVPFTSQTPLQQSTLPRHPELPVGMQPQSPSLAQKFEQQSESSVQATLSAKQPGVHTPWIQSSVMEQTMPHPPQLPGSL